MKAIMGNKVIELINTFKERTSSSWTEWTGSFFNKLFSSQYNSFNFNLHSWKNGSEKKRFMWVWTKA